MATSSSAGTRSRAGPTRARKCIYEPVRPRYFEPQKDPKEERDLAAERASAIQAQSAPRCLLELAGRPALALRRAEGLGRRAQA